MKAKKRNPPVNWNRVTELFDACVDMPAPRRREFLNRATANDPELRREVESLLASADKGGEFLENPKLTSLLAEPVRMNSAPPWTFRPVKVGKYHLLQKLGEGGMAEVYLAKTSGPGGFEKYVAVKRILPTYAGDTEFLKLFEYEARLSSLLSHANIVHIYDFAHIDDAYLLVMEHVAGKNLLQIIRKLATFEEKLPLEVILYVISEVCRGLEYAHSRKDEKSNASLNIVHRDISPKNIMISYDGAVKILDFGIAKARDRTHMTRTGGLRGTLDYMAPEIVNGGEVDLRGDIFSLAVIMYELISGEGLFKSENILQGLHLIKECKLPKERVAKLNLAPDLKGILLKALSKDPRDRYQHAGDMLADLQTYVNQNYSGLSHQKISHLVKELFAGEIQGEKMALEAIEAQPPAQTKKPEPMQIASAAPALPNAQNFTERKPMRQPAGFKAEPPSEGGFRTLLILGAIVAVASYLFYFYSTSKFTVPAPPPPVEKKPVAIETPAVAPPPPQVIPPAEVVQEVMNSDACLTKIQSEPTGVKVLMNGIEVGTTPTTVRLKCHAPIDLTLEHAGYETLNQTVIVKEKDSSFTLSLSKQ